MLPAKTLLKRAAYGGRKGRSAWRRLLGYRMSDLEAGGLKIEVDLERRVMRLVVAK